MAFDHFVISLIYSLMSVDLKNKTIFGDDLFIVGTNYLGLQWAACLSGFCGVMALVGSLIETPKMRIGSAAEFQLQLFTALTNRFVNTGRVLSIPPVVIDFKAGRLYCCFLRTDPAGLIGSKSETCFQCHPLLLQIDDHGRIKCTPVLSS
ncbi:hypothetical protein A9Q88_12365 [Gammaproteobacteria bacterium 50_400_T64]|nr:hypothetical protein A9Q88_12365 [Gammaproteobacteria bacterium 50_400_T64]